jgi:hypothetical protein
MYRGFRIIKRGPAYYTISGLMGGAWASSLDEAMTVIDEAS